MDLLWHKVPKLELVPAEKKHQSVISFHVISGLVHQRLHTKIGNRAHSIRNLSGIYDIPVNH